jgi:hypothetical protein
MHLRHLPWLVLHVRLPEDRDGTPLRLPVR